jgi:leader peptidase (prepilin peptidase) / N-methyltransferase
LLAVLHQTTTPVQSILGLVIGGGVPVIIATISRGAVGGGDVKLMAALGAALGWQNALYVFALSRALVVLGLTFISLARPRDRFPIGSFIALVGAIFVAVGL